MIKNLWELDKEEKILLIRAVTKGHTGKEHLKENTLVALEYEDFFMGLMITASSGNKGVPVICLGEALRAKKDMSDRISKSG